MSNIECPHCGSPVSVDKLYCASCGRRAAAYKLCDACKEAIANEALKCPHCSTKTIIKHDEAALSLSIEIRATHLGAFFTSGITGLILPPLITVNDGKILVTSWSVLGLRKHKNQIQLSRIASVRYTKGVFWGAIVVETYGGGDIGNIAEAGLHNDDAKFIAEQLKKVIQD